LFSVIYYRAVYDRYIFFVRFRIGRAPTYIYIHVGKDGGAATAVGGNVKIYTQRFNRHPVVVVNYRNAYYYNI